MHTIERKDENKLKQKLPIPTSQDNGIKRDAVVIVHIRIKLLEKVEKNNPIIGLNVFYVKKMSTYCAYISKHNLLNHENQISLLMISNRGQQSLAVKKLSALLRGVTFKKVGYFYCLNCLRSYRIKNKLESHIKVSKNTD